MESWSHDGVSHTIMDDRGIGRVVHNRLFFFFLEDWLNEPLSYILCRLFDVRWSRACGLDVGTLVLIWAPWWSVEGCQNLNCSNPRDHDNAASHPSHSKCKDDGDDGGLVFCFQLVVLIFFYITITMYSIVFERLSQPPRHFCRFHCVFKSSVTGP